MVRQAGFEPATYGLEGRCSIQLSYWRLDSVRNVTGWCREINRDFILPGSLVHTIGNCFGLPLIFDDLSRPAGKGTGDEMRGHTLGEATCLVQVDTSAHAILFPAPCCRLHVLAVDANRGRTGKPGRCRLPGIFDDPGCHLCCHIEAGKNIRHQGLGLLPGATTRGHQDLDFHCF